MQTHFHGNSNNSLEGMGAGGCAEWARERFFHMNEQMNEGLKKKIQTKNGLRWLIKTPS